MGVLRAKGIEAQIGTYSLHMHPAFKESSHCRIKGPLKASQYAYGHALALPSYHGMCNTEQEEVIKSLVKEIA